MVPEPPNPMRMASAIGLSEMTLKRSTHREGAAPIDGLHKPSISRFPRFGAHQRTVWWERGIVCRVHDEAAYA